MSDEMMNTREVARYLDIHEKQVYALIKAGRMPATRVTGKWIFPRKLINQWIESNAKAGYEDARRKTGRIAGALLAAGSNDPLLDILQTCLRKEYPEFFICTANTGSMAGLLALEKGHTDVAWSHLLDPHSGEYNIPYLDRYLPHVRVVVVNLFYRELGFVTAPGNPQGIQSVADLARRKVRFVNRQAGSGTRLLLDHRLGKAGIPSEQIIGYGREVFTHIEVGLAILAGEADTGIATEAVSKLLGLDFIPITRERFDMILDQSVFFQRGIQALMEVLTGSSFRSRVERLGNYDFSSAGKILFARP